MYVGTYQFIVCMLLYVWRGDTFVCGREFPDPDFQRKKKFTFAFSFLERSHTSLSYQKTLLIVYIFGFLSSHTNHSAVSIFL